MTATIQIHATRDAFRYVVEIPGKPKFVSKDYETRADCRSVLAWVMSDAVASAAKSEIAEW